MGLAEISADVYRDAYDEYMRDIKPIKITA